MESKYRKGKNILMTWERINKIKQEASQLWNFESQKKNEFCQNKKDSQKRDNEEGTFC